MKSARSRNFLFICVRSDCPSQTPSSSPSPISGRIVPRSSFCRKGETKRVRRFQCLDCNRSFSAATLEPEYRQKRRDLNESFRKLLCSSVSQRRIARLHGVDRKTVVRKFLFLAEQAKKELEADQRSFTTKRTEVQFDEMETFEHTKCKPLSIPLIVCAKTRKILGFSVASMPANGPLAKIALQKYGPREDQRPKKAEGLFTQVRDLIDPKAKIISDQNPKYPSWLKPHFPNASHKAYKGRRGCIVGQGELKKAGFDQLFSLNHTAAMIRANVNRLVRRTWCTTKKADRLLAHLYLYAQYHNTELIKHGKQTLAA